MGSQCMKMILTGLAVMILLAVLAVLMMYLFPKINFRAMPEGLVNGRQDEQKPNWVSSLVARNNAHYIAPLAIKNLSSLAECLLKQDKNTTLVKVDESSLIAYRQSTVFHFTDWIVIDSQGQVSASATMGHYDFGKNRQWVEAIRASCT